MSEVERNRVGKRRCFTYDLEDKGKNHGSRNTTTDSGKGKQMNSHLGSPEGAQTCQHL